jgi:hypothetical protein
LSRLDPDDRRFLARGGSLFHDDPAAGPDDSEDHNEDDEDA